MRLKMASFDVRLRKNERKSGLFDQIDTVFLEQTRSPRRGGGRV